jgi:hypothetical protein
MDRTCSMHRKDVKDKIMVRKPEGRHSHRWADNTHIRMDFKETA